MIRKRVDDANQLFITALSSKTVGYNKKLSSRHHCLDNQTTPALFNNKKCSLFTCMTFLLVIYGNLSTKCMCLRAWRALHVYKDVLFTSHTDVHAAFLRNIYFSPFILYIRSHFTFLTLFSSRFSLYLTCHPHFFFFFACSLPLSLSCSHI
jgi:hypothetical protein